jgi:D-xylose transport system substrate-binding protein
MKGSTRLIAAIACGTAVLAMGSFPASSHVFAAHSNASANAPVTGKVGFLFSDFTTSARWQFDKAFFIQEIHKLDPKVQVITTDAKADQTTQQNQAKSLLTQGVNVLIDVPVDSAQAAQIVKLAHAQKPRVPVLAYDRLITGAYEDAYASFNGYQVGVQQGKFIASHVAKGGTVVEIAGAPTDNNAHLFHAGAVSVLNPLFANGTLKNGYSQFTPNWDDAVAQQEMSSALNKLNNKVNGVLVANDGMAGGVIAALQKQHLAGKIPVTGQDATVAGLQQILLGNQSMTVYKPIRELSVATARIVNTWLHHKAFKSSVKTSTGAGKTPSVIKAVETVTKANIKTTVIKDGFVKKSDLCTSQIPASDCSGL